MTALNDLKTAYIECAKCWGLHASKFPFGTQRDKAGGNQFEFFPDGKDVLFSSDWW